jgi:putative transcriptional regulator
MMQRVDVKNVRQSLQMTQEQFAKRFGFKLCTLQQWEQGRRSPPKATCVLLTVIARSPDLVEEAARVAS